MSGSHSREPVLLSIAATERETGLSKDTLRMWERRYGFPTPARTHVGDRQYPLDQIERLRVVKRLLALGHRPGRIVLLPLSELHRLESGSPELRTAAGVPAPEPIHDRWLPLLLRNDAVALRDELQRSLMMFGLARFVTEVAAPLTGCVGDAWSRGDIEGFQEHLYTHALNLALREAIRLVTPACAIRRPRVLLTTVPGEQHALGLLMVEALLTIEGADCVTLGTQSPVQQIAKAARAQDAAIVCLSFSACANGHQLLAELRELRDLLPRTIEIWAGGSAPALHRRPIDGVQVFGALEPVPGALRRWRMAAGDPVPRGA